MGKRQAKKTTGWSKLGIGVAVSMGVYLIGILLIALLLVRGILAPEKGSLMLGAWVMVSTACGSIPVLKMKNLKPLLAALVQGGLFVSVVLVVSFLCWEGPVWCNTNMALLLCALVGALIPGALMSGGGKRKRKRAW